MDTVGPLLPSNPFSHILTCIDRFTLWPIGIMLLDTSSESMDKTLVVSWISINSVPSTIVTVGASQFTSTLYRQLSLLGSTHILTIAYHSALNGPVERFQQQLNSSKS